MTDKYRKKPVVIHAWQFLPDDKIVLDFPKWMGDPYDEQTTGPYIHADGETMSMHTLEGTMHARPGDWIIRGVKGEFYPCKPDIFAATYEPVES